MNNNTKKTIEIKWNVFFKDFGQDQELPEERKLVLVRSVSLVTGYPDPIGLGYLKFAAGDKTCPYFVTPGMNAGEPYQWLDVLPNMDIVELYAKQK